MEKIKNIARRYFFLALILAIGFAVRIYNLSGNPAGFFCDEASIGYNAYSLLHFGKDDFGNSFPIFFRSLGDFRPPLEIYSTIPFVFVFNLTEFSTRLPSVLFGIITVFAVYLLGKEILSKQLGLLAALIAATMPWLIHYNRVGFEFSLYCSLFTITLLLFIKASHHKVFLIPAFISAALIFYTYQPAKLLAPLLVLGLLTIHRKKYFTHRKELAAGLVIFFLLCLPLLLSFMNGEATARFNMVSVFAEKLTPLQTLTRVLQNYLIQLSPMFFINGEDTFITRHFTNGLAPVLIITLPFLLIGIMQIVLTINKRSSQVLAYWLFLYPIAGALTAHAPFTSRSIIGAPLFSILIAMGILRTKQSLEKKLPYFIVNLLILSFIAVNFIFFSNFYFNKYPSLSSDYWGWQYGPREIMSYFLKERNNYDQFIMPGDFNEPKIFIKFYDPNNTCKNRCIIGGQSDYKPKIKQLFAVSSDKIKDLKNVQMKTQKIVFYPDGKTAFLIGTFSPK